MLQTEIEWLSPEWCPKEVRHHTSKVSKSNREDMNAAFDNYQALQYGYKSYNDMITQMNAKHNKDKNRYGNMYIKGWM